MTDTPTPVHRCSQCDAPTGCAGPEDFIFSDTDPGCERPLCKNCANGTDTLGLGDYLVIPVTDADECRKCGNATCRGAVLNAVGLCQDCAADTPTPVCERCGQSSNQHNASGHAFMATYDTTLRTKYHAESSESDLIRTGQEDRLDKQTQEIERLTAERDEERTRADDIERIWQEEAESNQKIYTRLRSEIARLETKRGTSKLVTEQVVKVAKAINNAAEVQVTTLRDALRRLEWSDHRVCAAGCGASKDGRVPHTPSCWLLTAFTSITDTAEPRCETEFRFQDHETMQCILSAKHKTRHRYQFETKAPRMVVQSPTETT